MATVSSSFIGLEEPMHWYAMSVPYNRVLKVKSMLDEKQISCFVPMHYVVRTVRGRKMRLYVPAVSNLIFCSYNGFLSEIVQADHYFLTISGL